MFADVLLRYRIRSTAVSALGVCRRRRGAVQPATGGSKLLRREALQTGPGTAHRRRPAARLAVRYVTTRLLLMSHVAEQPNGATGARRVRTEVVSKGVVRSESTVPTAALPRGGGDRPTIHTCIQLPSNPHTTMATNSSDTGGRVDLPLKQYPEDAGTALPEHCRCGDDVATCDAQSPRVSRSHETGTPDTLLTHTGPRMTPARLSTEYRVCLPSPLRL